MNYTVYNNELTLTMNQLSELFNTTPKILSRNFQRNKDKYIEGKHYYVVKEKELKQLKRDLDYPDYLKFVSVLYLWTEDGANLLAKSVRNDAAWKFIDK